MKTTNQEAEMTPKEKLTQRKRILNYVKTNGFIDRLTALVDCGIFELSARVGEIEKKEGVKFNKKRKKGKSRFGDSYTCVEYSLEETA